MIDNEVGSTYSGPVFPRYGEQWFECHICGFDYPLHEARRHYKSQRLVCDCCDDEKTHSDYMQEMEAPREAPVETEQPVTCQGPAVDSAWYSGLWYSSVWYGGGHKCENNPTDYIVPQPGPAPPIARESDMFSGEWNFVVQTTAPPGTGELRQGPGGVSYLSRRDKNGYDRTLEFKLAVPPYRMVFRDNDGNSATYVLTSTADRGDYIEISGTLVSGDPAGISKETVLVSWFTEQA